MIKFTADGPNGTIIGLGITRSNVERLMKDEPILVKMKDINLKLDGGMNGEIFIFFGETEQDIAKRFVDNGMISPKTKVHKEEKK